MSLSFALFVLYCSLATTLAGDIAWRDNPSAAKSEAKSTGKLIWVQFTSPGCGGCLQMERDTFADDRVKSIVNDRYLPVKLRSDLNEALAAEHGLDRVPSTLILRHDGSVVDRFQGYAGPERFANFLAENAGKADSATTVTNRPEFTPEFEKVPVESVRTSREGDSGPLPTQLKPRMDQPAVQAFGRLEIDGNCPVSLVDGHILIACMAKPAISFEGRRYRFASGEMETRFRKNPRRYIPMNGGACPVSQVDNGQSTPGRARFGSLYQGHLYLFASSEKRAEFARNPERYAKVVPFDRSLCAECKEADHLSRKGTPRIKRGSILESDGRLATVPPSSIERK